MLASLSLLSKVLGGGIFTFADQCHVEPLDTSILGISAKSLFHVNRTKNARFFECMYIIEL